jgi:hypothetical protein
MTNILAATASFVFYTGPKFPNGYSTEIVRKAPWIYVGLVFIAIAQFVYYQMASNLHEMGNGSGRIVPWGVTRRYRAACHTAGRSPWLAYMFWVLLAAGAECLVFGIFRLRH